MIVLNSSPAYNVDSIVKEIQATIRQEAEMHQKESWSAIVFPTPAVRRMLLVGLGSAIAQQLSGIDSIQYFMLFVIDEAGINDQTTQYIILLLLGFLKMIVIVTAGRLFDTYGRRPMMKYPLISEFLFRITLLIYTLPLFPFLFGILILIFLFYSFCCTKS